MKTCMHKSDVKRSPWFDAHICEQPNPLFCVCFCCHPHECLPVNTCFTWIMQTTDSWVLEAYLRYFKLRVHSSDVGFSAAAISAHHCNQPCTGNKRNCAGHYTLTQPVQQSGAFQFKFTILWRVTDSAQHQFANKATTRPHPNRVSH